MLGEQQTLFSMKQAGHQAEIVGFNGPQDLSERLCEMGLHRGVIVTYLGQAPFGGPKLYRWGAAVLALRDEEAACVQMKPLL